jgi:hypothetical protein
MEHTGGCLCGAVRYEVTGNLRPVIACHCSQCRRQSGHYAAFTAAPDSALRIRATDALAWYRASPQAQRGFCRLCGSSLFWKQDGATSTSIAGGSLDGATGLHIAEHIFCADKGDYYEISDGAPCKAQW